MAIFKNAGKDGEEEPYTLLEEMQVNAITMENSMEVPQKPKNSTTT
jgi:hypothetical protein